MKHYIQTEDKNCAAYCIANIDPVKFDKDDIVKKLSEYGYLDKTGGMTHDRILCAVDFIGEGIESMSIYYNHFGTLKYFNYLNICDSGYLFLIVSKKGNIKNHSVLIMIDCENGNGVLVDSLNPDIIKINDVNSYISCINAISIVAVLGSGQSTFNLSNDHYLMEYTNKKKWNKLEDSIPPYEGYYEVQDREGNRRISYFGSSGAMGEPMSFFNEKLIKANEIIAWR